MVRATAWTQEEARRLGEMLERSASDAEIAEALGRTVMAVQSRIFRIGGRPDAQPCTPWSDEDRELAGLMLAMGIAHVHVAAAVGRSEGTIASQLSRRRITLASGVNRLNFKQGDRRAWIEDEDVLLDILAARGWNSARIAPLLGRTQTSVRTRMARLGVVTTRYPSKQKTEGSWRPCMSCQQKFRSEGNHNRICQLCKDSDLFR